MAQTKAVLYSRYSPRPGTSESCEVQLERCRMYCGAHDLKIIAEHKDERLSGGTIHRPGLTAAVDACCEKRAALVVLSLSRFARSTKDAILTVERLAKAHADFISVSENIDTTTPHGRFMFTLTAAIAELEREQIAERTSVAMHVHQSKGRRMSRYAPYGWKIDPNDKKRMIPNPDEEQAIKHVLELHTDGFGHQKISNFLNEQNVPYRGGKPWYREAVRRVVRREQSQPLREAAPTA